MRRTPLIALASLLLAGCTPRATVDLNANLNTGLNENINAGSNLIPPADIPKPDGGPPAIRGGEDANIEAELNAMNTADLDAEIGDIEAELNAGE